MSSDEVVAVVGLQLLWRRGLYPPAPETVDVANWVTDHVDHGSRRVVDLCTGVGTLGLVLAARRPRWTVDLVEVDADAVALAEENCRRNRLHNVTVLHADAAHWAASAPPRGYDLLVSNPPYVPEHRGGVRAEYPSGDLALFAGPDGLDLIRVVVDAAARALRPGGLLVVEHSAHDEQQEAVLALLGKPGWAERQGHRDSRGDQRFVTARRGDDDPTDAV